MITCHTSHISTTSGEHMRSAVRIATVTAASLALAVGSASAATASSQSIKDKRNDVVVNGKVGGHRSDEVRSAANRRDVTSVKITHGKENVSVKVNFANLQRSTNFRDSQAVLVYFAKKIKSVKGDYTPPGPTFGFSHELNSDPKAATLQEGDVAHGGELIHVCGAAGGGDEGGEVAPDLPQFNIDVKFGKNGYYKVQIPRECVGNPSKLKAYVEVVGGKGDKGYQDYVSPTKFKAASWTEWLVKG